MSDLQRLIGEQLKLIRKMKSLTQEQVAEKTGKEGMNKSRISDIERGRINISMRTLEMLMNALDIAPTELFDLKHLSRADDIQEKHMIIDIHRYALMDRELDEVKHVVDSTKNLSTLLIRVLPKNNNPIDCNDSFKHFAHYIDDAQLDDIGNILVLF